MLYQILKHRVDYSADYIVISMGLSHYYEDFLADIGIKVVDLQITKKPLSSILKIKRLLNDCDVLCCWMYYANFLGYYLGKFCKVKKIIWGIHHSDLSKEHTSKKALIINKLCSRLSNKVDLITYAGIVSQKVHFDCGYCQSNAKVVSNGCDLNVFKPQNGAEIQLRKELGIDENKSLILSVTKDIPIKDVPAFIKAAGVVKKSIKDVAFVMCGLGIDSANERITGLCSENDLIPGKDIFLLGLRDDIPDLLAGCDVYVLHSAGEAFPVTLVEAMACGCLCVCTNVGDVREILSDDRQIVNPGNYYMLSQSIIKTLMYSEEQKEAMKQNNREKALDNYDIRRVVRDYEVLFVG